MITHPQAAKQFLKDKKRVLWHDRALWYVRQKRDIQSKTVPQWERLREMASQIKAHTMQNLAYYLEEFEKNAQKNGIIIHWAKDAHEHNKIVHKILEQNSAKKVVKSKSMLTEECDLNPYLEQRGIEVVDTDLGERIIQLRGESPSHIVLPAIHLKKEDVSETFHKYLGSQKENSDPSYLTQVAREHLRQKFLQADAAITGVNFAIAQNGSIVVCTNEGNADMGTSLAKVHIASMGIEKIIPRVKDLGVFTRVLARSATGQAITTYTSHFGGARAGGEMHIIIVDNQRSAFWASKDYRQSLHCIRCGACMNTCPVYRRSGGHSYSYVVAGPIGSVLGAFRDPKKHSSLPFACTLCASCSDVCPVKIQLHQQLYKERQEIVQKGYMGKKKTLFKVVAFVMRYPILFDTLGKVSRFITPKLPKSILYNSKNNWTKYRNMPPIPKNSFKELYKRDKNAKQ